MVPFALKNESALETQAAVELSFKLSKQILHGQRARLGRDINLATNRLKVSYKYLMHPVHLAARRLAVASKRDRHGAEYAAFYAAQMKAALAVE